MQANILLFNLVEILHLKKEDNSEMFKQLYKHQIILHSIILEHQYSNIVVSSNIKIVFC